MCTPDRAELLGAEDVEDFWRTWVQEGARVTRDEEAAAEAEGIDRRARVERSIFGGSCTCSAFVRIFESGKRGAE